jgi:hypothetical protein
MGRTKKNEIVELPRELPEINNDTEVQILKMELEQLQRRYYNLYVSFRALNKTKNDLLDILMAVPKEES